MSPRYPRSPASMHAPALADDQRVVKQVRWVFVLAMLCAMVGGVVSAWKWWFPIAPEKAITVYWTHNCKCVFGWINSLEAAGFEVQSFEYETLKYQRAALQIPSNVHDCHVGSYLGYFVVGHVVPGALHRLGKESPEGTGLVTQALLTAQMDHVRRYLDKDSPVLLVNDGGQTRRWFDPAAAQ